LIKWRKMLWLWLLLFCTGSAGADDAAERRGRHFQAGNQAYLDGDYARAVSEYRQALELGPLHPDLAYNLANAYYKLGNKGLAVLFYEKALRLRPSDEAARANLALVRKNLVDRVVNAAGQPVSEPPWESFIKSLPLNSLSAAFLALNVIVFGLATLRRFSRRPALRRRLLWINLPLAGVLLVIGLFFSAAWYASEHLRQAVVIAPVAELREGPENTARVQMEVHEGLKVRLLQPAGDFVRVRLANGLEGYLRSDSLGEI
jgi:tetratricopeptide (TPR) repeat protein